MNWLGSRWLALLLAVELGNLGAGAAEKKLTVLTSFLPLYCFTANVAGNTAHVENLLPGSAGPHEYQFSRKDAQKLQAADLILINGLQLESWLEKMLRNVKGSKKLVEVSAGLETHFLYPASGQASGRSAHNPHLWLDPRLARGMVSNILTALQKADPAHGALYQANASAYIRQLQDLDAELNQALKPFANSAIITYHDAFHYFAQRYGLKIAGVVEVIPDVNPSPKHLRDLHHAALEQHVKAIFIEPATNPKQAKQLADDLRLPLATLDTIETGELNPAAYETAMRKNLQSLLNVFNQTGTSK